MLLDLPEDAGDDGRTRRFGQRGVGAGLLLPAAWLALAIPLSRLAAFGGWRLHWLVLAALLAAPAAALSWWAVGPGPQRSLWPTAVTVLALLTIPTASSGITPSPGRLSQIADSADLPGRVVSETRFGNGRCAPSCSEIRRTFVVDGVSFTKARAQTVGILKRRGYTVKLYSTRPDRPQRIDAGTADVLVSIEMRRTSLVKTTVEAHFFAQGPESSREIG